MIDAVRPDISLHSPYSTEQLLILDDLLRIRSSDEDQIPLLAYPRGKTIADFEHFTARQLDHFVDQAAKHYIRHDLSPSTREVAGLLSFSGLDALITFLALSRLGYTVLLLSPRLTSEACFRLLEITKATAVFYSTRPSLSSTVEGLRLEKTSLKMSTIATRLDWDAKVDADDTRFQRENVDRGLESQGISVICHSSGSTGLPKPIYQKAQRMIPPIPQGTSRNDYSTFPIYHTWGKNLIVSAMYHRKCLYLHNAELPLTGDNAAAALEHIRPGVFHAVPYTLKLLGETKRGIEALKLCSQVVFAGGSCPEDLGDRLTAEGIAIGTLFGGTEMGVVGVSHSREKDDKFWNYIRLAPRVRDHLQYKPIGDGTFEFVFLKTLPGLAATNSDDPPGSFHSRDIYEPHPTIPYAWKYTGRLDDRVTLSNGEKVLPVVMEGRVREHPMVREAVVFGIGRDLPGLLLFRSESAKDFTDEDYVDSITPVVEAANSKVERFARISRDMIVPMPHGVNIPYADKETIIRPQVYKRFSGEIDQAYIKLESASNGTLSLSEADMQKHILSQLQDKGIPVKTIDDDFHAAGMDSLQAIQLRSRIVRAIDLGHTISLPQNIVFDTGNVRKLAALLEALRTGANSSAESGVADMEAMIQQHGTFEHRKPEDVAMPKKHTVLLTGVTGSLGVHILAILLADPKVETIYCPVRGSNSGDRIQTSFQERRLRYSDPEGKIRRLPFLLEQPSLGLDGAAMEELERNLTLIVHTAWPVNFQLALPAFEPHVRGLHNLLQLSLQIKSPNPARLLFCSSISVALGTENQATIPEAPIASLYQTSGSGYAQSKLVAERIVHSAVQNYGAEASILRIGQIIGDNEHGVWNENEAPPMMIRSALILGMLPALDIRCSWLPVDTLASTIVDIATLPPDRQMRLVYNLRHPRTFSWTEELLPALGKAGLSFNATSSEVWMGKLREYAASVSTEEAVKNCPAVKLMDYYEAAYSKAQKRPVVDFNTSFSEMESDSLRNAPDVVSSGLIARMLASWMAKWKPDTAVNGHDLR